MEVLNGTRRPGFARVATRALRQQGLDVVFFGTRAGRRTPPGSSCAGAIPGQGRDVAEALGVGRVVIQPDTLRRVDVSVLLGSDWRPRLPLRP